MRVKDRRKVRMIGEILKSESVFAHTVLSLYKELQL
jgi:hypothetical protein